MSVRHLGDLNQHAIPPALIDDRPPSARVRVYVSSDVRLYREGLSASLSRQCTLDMVGAGSLTVTLRQIAEARPDVLLLDLGSEGSLSAESQRAERIDCVAAATPLRKLLFIGAVGMH